MWLGSASRQILPHAWAWSLVIVVRAIWPLRGAETAGDMWIFLGLAVVIAGGVLMVRAVARRAGLSRLSFLRPSRLP